MTTEIDSICPQTRRDGIKIAQQKRSSKGEGKETKKKQGKQKV